MNKPEAKSVTYYDWYECMHYLEEKYADKKYEWREVKVPNKNDKLVT